MPSAIEEKASRLGEYVDLLPPASDGIVVSSRTSSKSAASTERPLISECQEVETNWRAVYTVSAISMLTFLAQYIANIQAFPYLLKISSQTSVHHQGWQRVFIRIFHGIATASLAVHAYRSKRFRPSVLFGNVMLIVGCLLYVAIELVPENGRSWTWLLVFALQAAAEGANTVFNALIPKVTSKADRLKAYSYLGGSEVIAITLAPGIVVACHYLWSEEQEVLGLSWLKISEFTVPIWICLLIALCNQALIYFTLAEPPLDENQKPFLETCKQAWREIKSTDRRLLITCIGMKCVASFGCTTILTLSPPYVTTTFNSDERTNSFYLIAFQLVSGISAGLTAGLIVFNKTMADKDATRVFRVALGGFVVAYACSIPLANFYTHPVIVADEANPFGCDASQYVWCPGARIVDTPVWLVGTGAVFGSSFLMANIAHDTIYSEVIGSIDQNVCTGLLILVVDVTMAAVPIIATNVFEEYGPTVWWTIVAATMCIGFGIWWSTLAKFDRFRAEVQRRNEDSEIEGGERKTSDESTMTDFSGHLDSEKATLPCKLVQ